MDLRLLPYQPDRDVYRLLGVPPGARTVEIAAACRTLARAFHPDRNDSRRATEEMQVVNAVRALLTDPQSRAEYDRERHVFWSRAARSTVARPTDATATVRPATTARPAREAPAERERPGRPKLSRTARAAMAGLLAALRALHPTRCGSCGEWIEADHRFCGACGAPARTHLQVSPRPSR